MLPLLGFLAAVSAVFAVYVAIAFLPGILAGQRLEQRLKDVSGFDPPADGDPDTPSSRARPTVRCRGWTG